MYKIFQEASERLESGQDAVLVTIIDGSGSAPRGAGAKMLVSENGDCLGTIGGGAVEYEAAKKASEVLRRKKSLILNYSLAPGQAADLGMICGGRITVYFQFLSREDAKVRMICRKLKDMCQGEEGAWMILEITKEDSWNMGIYTKKQGLWGMEGSLGDLPLKNRAVFLREKSRCLYSEPLLPSGKVYVFGGGHVAQETVPVLSHLDFSCVVLDDRAEFASPERFPGAGEVLVCDFSRIGDYVTITEEDYVIIMTRGHLSDLQVQAQVLKRRPYYIGIMGSRRKIAAVTEKLLEQGFTEEEIAGCHMPVGNDIQAETPAEIAISIAGELIQERARRKQDVLTDR